MITKLAMFLEFLWHMLVLEVGVELAYADGLAWRRILGERGRAVESAIFKVFILVVVFFDACFTLSFLFFLYTYNFSYVFIGLTSMPTGYAEGYERPDRPCCIEVRSRTTE